MTMQLEQVAYLVWRLQRCEDVSALREQLLQTCRRVRVARRLVLGLFLIELAVLVAMWIVSGQLCFWVRS